jgi:hypothetical protein
VWSSSADGRLQLWDIGLRRHVLLAQWRDMGADTFEVSALPQQRLLFTGSNCATSGGRGGLCVYQLRDEHFLSSPISPDGAGQPQPGGAGALPLMSDGLPRVRDQQGAGGYHRRHRQPYHHTLSRSTMHAPQWGWAHGHINNNARTVAPAAATTTAAATFGRGMDALPPLAQQQQQQRSEWPAMAAAPPSTGPISHTGGVGAGLGALASAPLRLVRQLGACGEANGARPGAGLRGLSKLHILQLAHHPRSPGQIFAAYDDGQLVGWDVEAGRVRGSWVAARRRGGVRCIAADGQLLYAGMSDGYVRVWDQRTWRCVQSERLHDDYVNDLAIDRDIDRLCTASDDGRVGIVEVDGNTCAIQQLNGQRYRLHAELRRQKSIWVGKPVNTVACVPSCAQAPSQQAVARDSLAPRQATALTIYISWQVC